jgi:hypothetical protein
VTCLKFGEATNTNFIVFGLIRPGLEPTIYCSKDGYANHYPTDAALYIMYNPVYYIPKTVTVSIEIVIYFPNCILTYFRYTAKLRKNKVNDFCLLFVFFHFHLETKLNMHTIVFTAVDRGFEPRSDQTKDYKIGICCFSSKHATLRRKSKDWLARNQNNVSEWIDMSTRGRLFQ